MYNEKRRKITSLTLMTIMLAGGMTFAAPGMVPEAHAANANLFVSAESSEFSNYMSGPQVIEVVVINSDISDTDEGEGEPDVTVQGKDLRMTQAVDGNWYGYFADKKQALIADATASTNTGFGLDFGGFCDNSLVLTGDGAGTFATATVTAATAIATNTVTINGNLYSGVAGAKADNTQFSIDTGDTATAIDLADSINNDVRVGTIGTVFATSSGAVVTITTDVPGSNGNSVAITSSGATLAVTAFTGGTGGSGTILAQSTSFPDTVGVFLPSTAGIANIDPDGEISGIADITAACGVVQNGDGNTPGMNVVREAKDVNGGSQTVATGQIGVDSNEWPFIQLYSLNPTGNVDIQYNPAGPAQEVELTFDTVEQFASTSLDNSKYTTGALVHATITDLWLNIDPTDEDSWTFGTLDGNLSTNYQVFNENGLGEGDLNANGVIDISANLGNLMCEDNCVLIVNPNVEGNANPVLTIQDNDDSNIETTGDVNDATLFTTSGLNTALDGAVPVTITEQGPNSGVFSTYDEGDKSVLIITSNAARGTSASIDYNETPATILVEFDTATIDIQILDDEWNSGEEVPLVIVDGDANKNSRVDEDLDLFDPTVTLIPSLVTGDPFTLGEATTSLQVYTNNETGVINVPSGDVAGDKNSISVNALSTGNGTGIATVDKFSERAIFTVTSTLGNTPTMGDVELVIIDLETTMEELQKSISVGNTDFHGFNFFNYDVRSFGANSGSVDIYLLNSTSPILDDDGLIVPAVPIDAITLVKDGSSQDLVSLTAVTDSLATSTTLVSGQNIGLAFVFATADAVDFNTAVPEAIVADFFSFGFENDGLEGSERIANQIIRIEAEESEDNSSSFEGTLEYIMINQLNVLDIGTYEDLSTIADDPTFIVIEDLTDEDSPRVNYLDKNKSGVDKQISTQEEAPSHSGIVSFDKDSYKTADTVVITLEDLDLNVDSDLVDIYTTVSNPLNIADENFDAIGSADSSSPVPGTSIPFISGNQLGRLLDITFDDNRWTTPVQDSCTNDGEPGTSTNTSLEELVDDTGLGATGFTLVESSQDSGIFVGSFEIPGQYCAKVESGTTGTIQAVTGLDIEVNYVDFRDASGEIIEVGDSAGVRANTGSVSLDRTVYPVPFGIADDFSPIVSQTPDNRSVFPIHQSGMNGAGIIGVTTNGLESGEFLDAGDLIIHVRVNDADFDISASGEDEISTNSTSGVGPVKISVIRGSEAVILGFAGGDSTSNGRIDTDGKDLTNVRAFGPMVEIAPDAGIFETDITIRYTDGPASTTCPDSTDEWTALNGASTSDEDDRFDTKATAGNYCILQGDILQVEYTDPADASGDINTVTDSATFDLRNGVLQSDKSVYIIGSDMIVTLIEPDFDLDNDQAETYDLDLIEWDSDAATITMGDAGDATDAAAFDPEPSNFRETGDSTGIFQIVIEIPQALEGDTLERGEEIVLEYTDWGPSGSDFVGDEDEDVNLTIFTSNFGATVELDQKVYSWTDKVYITIVAPDHNFDGDLIDEIGNTEDDPIKVSTRGDDLEPYKLVETGTDTGIFTGEVILTGFPHDADGDTTTGVLGNDVNPEPSTGSGPTDGKLTADDDDGLTVSFEFSEDETVVGSAIIRWNIGEIQWLEASYPASGTGVVRVIDPDMNLDPEAVDNFDADIWSDSDAGGIDLTVTETNEATGIFEGTVFFTVTDESSGHRLRVAEGDTVTAEYEDNTLPDPYTTADELDVTATSLIGTVVPPLERAPAANLRTVDAFGNSLDTVTVDQQVQISADLANGQDREQTFAYLVQIQDGNGVTVSLAWITGTLTSGQSFSPALSWIPEQAGAFTATAFVWESVDNPTALSPPVGTQITVQ